MSDIFEFKSQKKNFAVIGDPIEHSLSPTIHQLFAEQFSIDLSYQKIQVDPGGFHQAVSHFMAHDGTGLNITVPYKLEAWQLCHKSPHTLSARALQAGAVNTLKFSDNGEIHGDNTDGIGLARDLQNNLAFQITNQRILIVGAGGSVRGILATLIQLQPAQIVIANRTVSKARELASTAPDIVTACGLGSKPERAFDLVINATSASLSQTMLQLEQACIGQHTVAYDLMYSDQKTPFMQWVLGLGAQQVVDGLGMLVEQAAEAFFIWHDERPDTKSVLAKLRKY